MFTKGIDLVIYIGKKNFEWSKRGFKSQAIIKPMNNGLSIFNNPNI